MEDSNHGGDADMGPLEEDTPIGRLFKSSKEVHEDAAREAASGVQTVELVHSLLVHTDAPRIIRDLPSRGPNILEEEICGMLQEAAVFGVNPNHLKQESDWIAQRPDSAKIVVEVRPLTHYLRSDETHQDRLTRCPDDICHLPKVILHKYKK